MHIDRHCEVTIVTGPNPDSTVSYAATELNKYLRMLFGVNGKIVPSRSSTADDGAQTTIFLDAAGAGEKIPADEQQYVLKRLQSRDIPSLLACGGSATATMWAVYDLVERWGVRYLLRGDVIPTDPGPFRLPDVDVVRQPNLRTRGVRLINLFPMGLESWGLTDIERYLDQLAKLRFNSVYHQLWSWQPFIHYECNGWSKCTAEHWFGLHYPINDDTIGRHHFGDMTEFVPPDFEGCRTYDERIEAGQRLIHGTLSHAKKRGFCTEIAILPTDLPVEFGPMLDNPPLSRSAMGRSVAGGHKGVDDPAFQTLLTAVLRAHINTYPQVDRYSIATPEFRSADVSYKASWDRLGTRYDFASVRTLDQVLEEASKRDDYPGGTERMVAAVKGDIVWLDLFDRLLNEQRILECTAKPDAEICMTAISEELMEVYSKMRPGATINLCPDYTSSRIAKRLQALGRPIRCGLKPLLIMTTQDDNIGVLAQNSTESIHRLLGALRKYDWEGFQLRYWMICDMEPLAAYLTEACWDEAITPRTAYQKHIESIAGPVAVGDMVAALEKFDEVTIELGDHGLGIGFPVPPIGVRRWYTSQSLTEPQLRCRQEFKQILELAESARAKATYGHEYLDYFIGRIEFTISYFDLMNTVASAGKAYKNGDHQRAISVLEAAVELAKTVVGIHARITIGPTDLGTLAQLNEDLCRKLKWLLESVRANPADRVHMGDAVGGILVEG